MPPAPSATEVAERIYAHEGAKATDDEAARTVTAILEQLERATSSVVGEIGFRAMYSRCLRKSREAYPSLREVEPGARGALFEPLIARLEHQDRSVAIAVGTALLAAFFELLATLIGADMTFRLFRDAWPEALSGRFDPVEKP